MPKLNDNALSGAILQVVSNNPGVSREMIAIRIGICISSVLLAIDLLVSEDKLIKRLNNITNKYQYYLPTQEIPC